MEEDKKPFKWIDKEEWDFHNKQLPSRYIAGCDPIEENSPIKILPLQEYSGYRWDNLNKHTMENEKYYTPTLNEFHVGFDYEEKIGDEWISRILDQIYENYELPIEDDDNDLKRFRVKYLDKEDIESIGFKHIGGKMVTDVGQLYSWNNKRYWVHLNYTKLSDHCVIKIETSVEQYSIKTLVVHSIGIKNKSELLILFKQLNIL